jgi:N-acetylglucosamine kinase-like BadF-type ATPase
MTSNPRQPMTLVMGIDGGGTKTIAWLGKIESGRLIRIGIGRGAASNPRAVGFETAFLNLTAAIRSAFQDAGLPVQPLDRACLCLAGAGRVAEQQAIQRWTRETLWTRRLRLVSEAEATLASVIDRSSDPCIDQRRTASPGAVPAAAQQLGAEVALICGTGSLAWGRDRLHQRHCRCGGWGYLLGDEGSGYWIGQQLLNLACRAADGRSNQQPILSAVLERLQLEAPEQIVAWCFGDESNEGNSSRGRIAELAPLAFEFSDSPKVSRILQQGAQELSRMIGAVVRALDAPQFELAMAGSVVLQQASYRQSILACLAQESLVPVRVHVADQPVAGTLWLAASEEWQE